MKKAVYSVMIITILAKILGFGRELLLSYFFGASGVSDAYLVSQTIPGTIFQFVGTGLATSFVPVYMKVKNEHGQEKANGFTDTILTGVMLFSTVVIVLVWIFAEPIVRVFASGFEGQTLQYAIFFTRVCILSLYFSAMIYVFNSYLQINNVFNIVVFGAIPNSIAIMVAIILGAKVHIWALPVGSLIAIFLQLLCLWPAVLRQKYHFRPRFKFRDVYVKEIMCLMIPVVLGVSVNQINVLVDRTIASQIATGGISALMYADSLIMFVQGVFSQSIATVYYPSITQMAEQKKVKELKDLINESLSSMAFILIPVMIGCIVLGTGIVRMLYGRGAFDNDAINMTGTALSFYGLGIVGYGFREIFARVFYSYHDTKTPMTNAMIGMFVNIVLNLALSKVLGIGGLALATSISSILTAWLLYINLKKKIGSIFRNEVLGELKKMSVAALVMGIIVSLMFSYVLMHLGILMRVLFSVSVGIGVYFLLSRMFGITIYMHVINMIKNKLRR